ncbi:NU6M oxidoreductase, partial [Poecile atricapillus]|nr:NU6M oxidoreductase [Poecile atricapillus]
YIFGCMLYHLLFIIEELAVASNPCYYYGVVGLVSASVAGCGWLMSPGTSFVLLVLFLVCLGGILVGFVFTLSLAVGSFPEVWG